MYSFESQEVLVAKVREKCVFPWSDASLNQEGSVVPRPLRHREFQTDDDDAGGNSNADEQSRPPSHENAGGNSGAGNLLPNTSNSVERDATEDKDDFWSTSSDYRHHVAPMCLKNHRAQFS